MGALYLTILAALRDEEEESTCNRDSCNCCTDEWNHIHVKGLWVLDFAVVIGDDSTLRKSALSVLWDLD